MKRFLLSILAGCLNLANAGTLLAQTSSAAVPALTKEQGLALRAYSETQKNTPFFDPNLKLREGIELPQNATLHLIPDSLKVGSPDLHAYSIINDHAVLVDRSTRKVIHIWK